MLILSLITDYWPKDSVTINDLLDLKPEANLVFNSFSLGFESDKILVNNVTGNMSVSDIIMLKILDFYIRNRIFELMVNSETCPNGLPENQYV